MNTRTPRRTIPGRWLLAAAAASVLAFVSRADFQGSTHVLSLEDEVINYSRTPEKGPIQRLQKKIDTGEVKFEYDAQFGYLPSLLKNLNVAPAGQMLVFSKTSFQRERIAPGTPRALYVGDDVYVGFVLGSHLLEISAVDPVLGGVFYTLEQKKTERPKFVRTDNCTECHASAKSMGVPGHLVRSFKCDESGIVDLLTGTDNVDHRTPLTDRWGGWYVTGKHGSQVHRGNLFGEAAFARQEREPNWRGNLSDLKSVCDTSRYLAPGSDIVALMVMEHQAHMHNYLTRLQYEARQKIAAYGHVDYLRNQVEGFVKYLLFAEEIPLTSPIEGNADYVKWFESQGPRDSKGRSLREFDLKTRMFKYPCSYLIQSEAFDALPEMLKARIYKRLWEVLSGQEKSEAYARLTPESRRAIAEILQDTKHGLPNFWML